MKTKLLIIAVIIQLLVIIVLATIIIERNNELRLEAKRTEFLEDSNLQLQNANDNLQEDIDTLKKQATKIIYVTKIKEGKRDSIFVTIPNTNFADIDSCNSAVRKLFEVCKLDKEIIKDKNILIETKDTIIYKLELQKGNLGQMVDNKNEVNEHLQEEIKVERIRKKGAITLFTAMAILNAYLMIKK